ncbi:DUF4134 domain-containing protein [Chitinophaga sp. NPDC101104]|uniref:DUF4134 domain-containing protein n=1 Tax=Chitinophaga sp. NPDC101104 TaxID=3390561 RepID=UPI003D026119
MKTNFQHKSEPRNRQLIFFAQLFGYTLLLSLLTITAFAQSGEQGLMNATTEVKKYFDHGTKLMYAIGAIVGIVGAVKVFGKFNSGDQDTGKVASAWLGSCIFLIVVSAILRGFFL